MAADHYDTSHMTNLPPNCPYEEITCGSLEERLCTPEKRKILVNFLLNEIKAARLFAKDALNQPVSESGDKELTPYLISALNAVNVPKPSGSVAPLEIISLLHKAVGLQRIILIC
ncbi:unnamed protein product [Strongylus vulgaris]|uniref:Uncharacterized protein n=1 Tax=Strongylus vulgaris TaxID=40348 RepID=A0A3P7JBM8_STRVU|nr:unnamed protein product [Strongylus vulgaris]